MKEGAAVDDFLKPDRVVIGTGQASVAEIMKDLYAPLTRTGAPILVMDPRELREMGFTYICIGRPSASSASPSASSAASFV